jgi:hypothetical protein
MLIDRWESIDSKKKCKFLVKKSYHGRRNIYMLQTPMASEKKEEVPDARGYNNPM